MAIVFQIDNIINQDHPESGPSSADQVRQLLFDTDTGSVLHTFYTQFARRRTLARRRAGETVPEDARFLPLEPELEIAWLTLGDLETDEVVNNDNNDI
jgi:hypothetical protein